MSVQFQLEQGKVNAIKISVRKRILNKVQTEIIDIFTSCVTTSIPSIERETIRAILICATRDWEMEKKLFLNDFNFMHVNDRIREFDKIFEFFIERLQDLLLEELTSDTIDFLRKASLTNYRDYLGSEGYVVDYYSFN
ncbi:MAG: hypothetical protein ACFFDS_02795 [Candidatus Thorarchaeota archaeon]